MTIQRPSARQGGGRQRLLTDQTANPSRTQHKPVGCYWDASKEQSAGYRTGSIHPSRAAISPSVSVTLAVTPVIAPETPVTSPVTRPVTRLVTPATLHATRKRSKRVAGARLEKVNNPNRLAAIGAGAAS